MQRLMKIERFCLWGHLISMAFGLAGLLLVMPHPEVLSLLPAGQTLFGWSMAGGGVVYIVLGTIAVALHAYRTLGLRNWLAFLVPAVGISLSSELLGTSTGFPFGHYSYLSGLGYKISGLVPFTIPLSWFYLGLSAYILARMGLRQGGRLGLVGQLGAIALGALLLTSWDFVLDPAMSQTAMPFWYWHQPGAFFGMPYQNFVGWMGTGIVFMGVAATANCGAVCGSELATDCVSRQLYLCDGDEHGGRILGADRAGAIGRGFAGGGLLANGSIG
jgi:uncharacterized membrane protein